MVNSGTDSARVLTVDARRPVGENKLKSPCAADRSSGVAEDLGALVVAVGIFTGGAG
jgi:hypothetical protein